MGDNSNINLTEVDITVGKSENREKKNKNVLRYRHCEEFRNLLESQNCEELKTFLARNRATEKEPPEDAVTIDEFLSYEKDDICARLNEMSTTPHKSNLIVMYAHGYGFSWTRMVERALGGQIIKDPNNQSKTCPRFIVRQDGEQKDDDVTGSQKKVIYIDHGYRPDTLRERYTFSHETTQMIRSMFGRMSNLDRSKVIEILLREQLEAVYQKFRDGDLEVRYNPRIEEPLKLGPRIHKNKSAGD